MKKLFTFLSAAFLTTTAFAQIPNGSFETWTTVGGYDSAASWSTPNFATAIGSVYTAEKGTTAPVPDGSAFMKLTTKTLLTYKIPGVAATAKINISTGSTPPYSVTGGFPMSTRPASLTGSWQYMPATNDTCHVIVLLTKWNTALNKRDTIIARDSALTGMAMSWTAFTIPFTYAHGETPDTGLVLLSSSGFTPVAGSYLYADKLAFTGTVPNNVTTVNTAANGMTIFPNPASGKAIVYYRSATVKNVQIDVVDMNGRMVRTATVKAINGDNNFPIDLAGIAKGIYLVRATADGETAEQKLVVE